jgi:hypothetical protein
MRAIDQALTESCPWGANPFRLGKDSQWFVGLPEAVSQHRLGVFPGMDGFDRQWVFGAEPADRIASARQ